MKKKKQARRETVRSRRTEAEKTVPAPQKSPKLQVKRERDDADRQERLVTSLMGIDPSSERKRRFRTILEGMRRLYEVYFETRPDPFENLRKATADVEVDDSDDFEPSAEALARIEAFTEGAGAANAFDLGSNPLELDYEAAFEKADEALDGAMGTAACRALAAAMSALRKLLIGDDAASGTLNRLEETLGDPDSMDEERRPLDDTEDDDERIEP